MPQPKLSTLVLDATPPNGGGLWTTNSSSSVAWSQDDVLVFRNQSVDVSISSANAYDATNTSVIFSLTLNLEDANASTWITLSNGTQSSSFFIDNNGLIGGGAGNNIPAKPDNYRWWKIRERYDPEESSRVFELSTSSDAFNWNLVSSITHSWDASIGVSLSFKLGMSAQTGSHIYLKNFNLNIPTSVNSLAYGGTLDLEKVSDPPNKYPWLNSFNVSVDKINNYVVLGDSGSVGTLNSETFNLSRSEVYGLRYDFVPSTVGNDSDVIRLYNLPHEDADDSFFVAMSLTSSGNFKFSYSGLTTYGSGSWVSDETYDAEYNTYWVSYSASKMTFFKSKIVTGQAPDLIPIGFVNLVDTFNFVLFSCSGEGSKVSNVGLPPRLIEDRVEDKSLGTASSFYFDGNTETYTSTTTGGGSSVSVVNTSSAHGNQSYQVSFGTSTSSFIEVGDSTFDSLLGIGSIRIASRFYVNFKDAPVSTSVFARVRASNASFPVRLVLGPGMNIQARDSTQTAQPASTSPSLLKNTWYRIDFAVTRNGSTTSSGTIEYEVYKASDESLVFSYSDSTRNTGPYEYGGVQIGKSYASDNWSGSLSVDDIAVQRFTDSGFIGVFSPAVTGQLPVAVGMTGMVKATGKSGINVGLVDGTEYSLWKPNAPIIDQGNKPASGLYMYLTDESIPVWSYKGRVYIRDASYYGPDGAILIGVWDAQGPDAIGLKYLSFDEIDGHYNSWLEFEWTSPIRFVYGNPNQYQVIISTVGTATVGTLSPSNYSNGPLSIVNYRIPTQNNSAGWLRFPSTSSSYNGIPLAAVDIVTSKIAPSSTKNTVWKNLSLAKVSKATKFNSGSTTINFTPAEEGSLLLVLMCSNLAVTLTPVNYTLNNASRFQYGSGEYSVWTKTASLNESTLNISRNPNDVTFATASIVIIELKSTYSIVKYSINKSNDGENYLHLTDTSTLDGKLSQQIDLFARQTSPAYYYTPIVDTVSPPSRASIFNEDGFTISVSGEPLVTSQITRKADFDLPAPTTSLDPIVNVNLQLIDTASNTVIIPAKVDVVGTITGIALKAAGSSPVDVGVVGIANGEDTIFHQAPAEDVLLEDNPGYMFRANVINSDNSLWISGVAFWRPSSLDDVQQFLIFGIWDSSGNLLTSARIWNYWDSGEHLDEWIRVKLASPISIVPGTNYYIGHNLRGQYYSQLIYSQVPTPLPVVDSELEITGTAQSNRISGDDPGYVRSPVGQNESSTGVPDGIDPIVTSNLVKDLSGTDQLVHSCSGYASLNDTTNKTILLNQLSILNGVAVLVVSSPGSFSITDSSWTTYVTKSGTTDSPTYVYVGYRNISSVDISSGVTVNVQQDSDNELAWSMLELLPNSRLLPGPVTASVDNPNSIWSASPGNLSKLYEISTNVTPVGTTIMSDWLDTLVQQNQVEELASVSAISLSPGKNGVHLAMARYSLSDSSTQVGSTISYPSTATNKTKTRISFYISDPVSMLPVNVGVQAASTYPSYSNSMALPISVGLVSTGVKSISVSSGTLPVTIGLVGTARTVLSTTGSLPVNIELNGKIIFTVKGSNDINVGLVNSYVATVKKTSGVLNAWVGVSGSAALVPQGRTTGKLSIHAKATSQNQFVLISNGELPVHSQVKGAARVSSVNTSGSLPIRVTVSNVALPQEAPLPISTDIDNPSITPVGITSGELNVHISHGVEDVIPSSNISGRLPMKIFFYTPKLSPTSGSSGDLDVSVDISAESWLVLDAGVGVLPISTKLGASYHVQRPKRVKSVSARPIREGGANYAKSYSRTR